MITPSFSSTATERVLPKLALDFTTASLDSRVTFTRTTGASNPATYVNSSGAIASATNDQPRFDYNPTTLICKGLLIEESRTNACTNSVIDGAVVGTPGTLPTGWVFSQFGVSNIASQVVATGTDNGINYIDLRFSGTPNAGGVCALYMFQGKTAAVTGQAVACSAYMKLASGSFSNVGALLYGFSEYTSADAPIKNDTGIISNPTSASLITQRLAAVITTSGGATTAKIGNFNLQFGVTSGAAIDFTIRLGLPQLELGAFATSAIPTTTTALTRNADVATMTGTNFSSWFNATEGTIVVNATKTISGNFPSYYVPISLDDGTTSNRIVCSSLAGSTAMYPVMRVSNVDQLDFVSGNFSSGSASMAVGYKQNNTQFAISGVSKTADTACSIPTVNQLSIGSSANSGFWNGLIRTCSYYPQRLTSAELAAFTK